MSSFDELAQMAIEAPLPQSKVVGIAGSPRKGGNSDILLKYLLKGVAENQVAADSIQLRDYQYQGCIGCERCRKDKICTGLKDGMSLIYSHILESQGLMIRSKS